jgi:hypothetical protein
MPISPKLFFIKDLPDTKYSNSNASNAIIYAYDQGIGSTHPNHPSRYRPFGMRMDQILWFL